MSNRGWPGRGHYYTRLFPSLFGEPFPEDHPWAAPPKPPLLWPQTKRVHLATGGSCTACSRGVCRSGTRLSTDWRRLTCAFCLRIALDADAELRREVARVEQRQLYSAIGWWRHCGSFVHGRQRRLPSWVAAYLAADAGADLEQGASP